MLREAYELVYTFNNKRYADLLQRSYQLKNKYKLKESISHEDMHIHNTARIINSLTGDILGIINSRLL
jgi:hypothetical protein